MQGFESIHDMQKVKIRDYMQFDCYNDAHTTTPVAAMAYKEVAKSATIFIFPKIKTRKNEIIYFQFLISDDFVYNNGNSSSGMQQNKMRIRIGSIHQSFYTNRDGALE